ncbi:tyrosine-type recombinase/integrase [Mesorhizobium sp. RMAD-H1]|uniref:tyrosine-type recombinase/integrase n=1 Tax=Mesorhizobium sp. RMAD-H1 TaxID=2587065 RepID=UPI00161DB501|nr:tyrosine-type recombinase/integrase [Mesorhizobium sp. RMAD-H1]MBB2973986.1 antitoxin component of RelBE/YafQ-DinJ toxin-antitoxin module [Mesorhizobium sp. RMAD-H1]
MADYLTKRRGFWHFARRVPKEFAQIDNRGIVKETTKIRIVDDPRGIRAGKIAEGLNAALEQYWHAMVEGKAAEARQRYDTARKRARALGFDYVEAAELAAERSASEIVARFEQLMSRNALDSESEVAAVLGGESPPEILISEMFGEFRTLQRASLSDFSVNQLRKWENPRKRAVNNLITVVGDKALHRLTRADGLDFRTWWQDRVLEEGLQIDTANKDIGHLNNMLTGIDEAHHLGLQPVFADLRIRGGGNGSRSPFDPAFVQNRILKEGALDELNEEARHVLYLMVETGLRISEACNLTAESIILKAKIPHVKVRPEGRRMKTPQSEREIPLVGVSLMALSEHPEGFPRYRDRADSLSAILNKVMGSNKMRPTDKHSAYSLRHTFEDRLTAVEAPEKLIAALMGHKYSRPKYGAGPSLEQKEKWLKAIAFKPPARI